MIEKITDQNLERYDSRLKEWCDRKFFEKGNYGKYQTTEESDAVAFYPVPNTLLEGKVKFSFKETLPASGDKGPENPSTLVGVNQIHVANRGKNFYIFNPDTSSTYNGVTISISDDKTITLNGTCNASIGGNRQIYIGQTPIINIPIEKHVVASIKHISGSYSFASGLSQTHPITVQMVRQNKQNGTMAYLWMNDSGVDSTSIKDLGYYNATVVNIYCLWGSTLFLYGGVTYNNYKIQIQYEFTDNENSTEYEPPIKQLTTIDLGNTYYGGEIDLATGVMTMKSQKVMIDGDCSYILLAGETNEDRVALVVTIPDILSSDELKLLRSTSSCDRLPLIQYQNITNSDECIMFGGEWQIVRYKQIRVYMLRSTLDISSSATAEEVQEAAKTWFSSHPATFIAGYEESHWTTVQLTPIQIFSFVQTNKYTPKLNTVYTDADSVQISYLKSPIRDEYEKTQAILSLGGNS